ncbi:MAG TPA: hypothetical protein VJ436_01570 [Anaerolineales bacterium]|nr:hypothetical protein [Anaerolineales bacterium]
MNVPMESQQIDPLATQLGRQTKDERRWVILFAVLVMAATSLPTLFGYTFEGENWRFTGFVFAVEDGNSYLAKMARGAAGEWLFQTPYTAWPQRGALLFLPYLLLGKLASPPGLHVQLAVLYHLFRFLAGLLAILATYDFLVEFVQPVGLRRWGLALATLGGGLGWTLALIGQTYWLGSYPLEFYSPETFGFLGLYGFPHLALGRALLLWGLSRFLQQARSPIGAQGRRAGLEIGGLWLVAGLAQPLAAAIGLGLLGLTLAALAAWLRWRTYRGELVDNSRWWRLALTVAWAVPLPGVLLLYQAWSVSQDSFLQVWAGQNLIRSPHPLHYLLAYGLLLPFAWLGGRRLLRAEPWSGWLLVAWALALPFLAYAPLDLQRRLGEGGWVALVALAMMYFAYVPRPGAGWKIHRRLLPVLCLLALPSTLMLVWGGLAAATRPGLPIFHPVAEVQAFEYLQQAARLDEVVLASYATGNALPAWAAVKVVIGHGPESAGLAELLPRVEAFYQKDTPDGMRRDLIAETGADYVFWGPHERELGDWDPHLAVYLEEVFSSGEYLVYKVMAESP